MDLGDPMQVIVASDGWVLLVLQVMYQIHQMASFYSTEIHSSSSNTLLHPTSALSSHTALEHTRNGVYLYQIFIVEKP